MRRNPSPRQFSATFQSQELHPVAPKRVLAYPRGTETTNFRAGCFHADSGADRPVLLDRQAARGRTDYFDETVPGLALRVTEHGHRSWSLPLHVAARRQARAGDDRHLSGDKPRRGPWEGAGSARPRRGGARSAPRAGGAGDRRHDRAGLVDAYLADPEKAALRSKAEIERRLRKNVVPIIGEVKLAELRRRDVRNVTDAMLRRGVKVEATRIFEDVRAMVRWAVQNEYLDANPLDGMGKPAEATSSNRVSERR